MTRPVPPGDEPYRQKTGTPTVPSRGARGPAFGAGRRTTARDPQAYSRAVTLAKVALPAFAAAILALVALWPALFGEGGESGPALSDTGQLEMVDARYLGTDSATRPFEVRAAKAVQTGPRGEIVDLIRPEAEVSLEDGAWMSLTADRGRYDQTSGRLRLDGNVSLYHDGGYEFVTDSAEVDTQRSIAWGNARVRGQGPIGDIDAGGFRILDDGNTLVFTGTARMRLLDGAGGGRG